MDLTVFFSEEWLDDGNGAAGEGINTAGKSMTFPFTAKIHYTSGKCH
jgi:hypothetical protein